MTKPLQPPPGYEVFPQRGQQWVVRVGWRSTLAALPVDDPTALATRPGARARQGRATHWSFDTDGGRVLVRSARRGGLFGPVLGPWHWSFGAAPRPLQELRSSEAARAAGVDTPQVLGAVWEPGSLGGYRAWILVEEIPRAFPLIDLWRVLPNRPDRAAALAAAAKAIATLHNAGFVHPDLNATNILVAPGNGEWRAWIIDLDRVRAGVAVTPRQRALALWRLVRSCLKHRAAGVRIPWTAAPHFLAVYQRHATCGAAPVERALRATRPWVRAKWWASDMLRVSRPITTATMSWKTSQ